MQLFRSSNRAKLILTTLFVPLLTSSGLAISPIAETDASDIVPHRAVYELDLKDALQNSNIVDAEGRMVFEFTGSACEGYLVNMRFVLTIADNKGKSTLTDVRSSSWEGGKGERFRFNSSQYFNSKLSKTTIGDAARRDNDKGVKAELKSPKKSVVKFPGNAYFPTQHTRLMIGSAMKGESVLNAPIYDGSESGNTLYKTTAIIGKGLASDASVVGTKIENLDKLKDMISWPISLSFYDDKKSVKQDLLPDYEISFRLYANGVSRNLLIDYGEFSLTGKMSKIEFLPQTKCEQ